MNTVSYIIAGLIIAFSIFVVSKTSILKDSTITPSNTEQKSFSFARTQGFWWTTIIAVCSILAFGKHGEILINSTCLVLMGIGVGTTAVGKVIDDFDSGAGIARHQDQFDKEGFFMDILSDNTGVSVHRYQLFVFNIIFTIVFLTDFFSNDMSFPTFDNTVLGLLGISSGTYLGVKATENKAVATN
jgi:hypothetical protein